MERILGLDVGDKTIGVAVSDLLQITAQGVTTIRREGKKKDLLEIEKLIDEYDIKKNSYWITKEYEWDYWSTKRKGN